MSRTVFDPFVNEDGELRIQLLVQPAVNYALVHNRVPVVRQLVLANHGERTLGDLEVEVELVGADGPLAPRWCRTVAGPLRPGAALEWDDFTDLVPDVGRLARADEAFPAEYRVVVREPGGRQVSLVAPSRVLAHNEWFHTPALYDILAAFVQPNTKAVDSVSRSAASILLKRTGSGSLNGYQAGPLRASHIAGAVYEALRQLGITYRTAPASFEETGQKIRTVADVLEGRQGNCLDLSVTYAACLEAAGLRPLIFLTEGHAFGGFLAAEERLDTAAATETNLLVSLVDAGKAVPVELTGIGPGEQTTDFPTAVELGMAHLRRPEHRLRGVVDVHLAHRTGIQPLPSTDTAFEADVDAPSVAAPGEGSIELPVGVVGAVLAGQADSEEVVDETDSAPERIRRWKKSLLDLSLRNPLLNLPRTGRGLDLHVPQDDLATLDDLIHDGKRIDVIPQDRISQVHALAGARRAQDLDPAVLRKELRERRIYGAVTEQRYRTVMRRLQRDARTMTQETGSNYLYLTIGTLVHPKSSGGEAHAPLFLLPVRIEGGAGARPYHLVVDGTEVATPNHCLVEWLRVKHRVRIPELENPPQDEHGLDIPRTLTAIRKRLVENRLNYRVEETASLRLLQFSTFQMWRDLTDHWSTFMENPVVRHLVEQPGTSFLDPVGGDLTPDIDEADLHLPIPADGSQMRAVVMAERGQSFVLEGPPGTGKSQTITNLLARAIAAGRTVLFVAEKQAALEVVKRRLESVGLAPFALGLHGRKQSMKAIRHQLREALEARTGGGDDAAWAPVETTYRTRLASLVDYPERVHQANPTGMSLWSAYEATLAYGPGPAAEIPRAHLNSPRAGEAVRTALRELPAAARSAGLRAGHPWSLSAHRVVDGLDVNQLRQLAASLESARSRLDQAPSLVRIVRQTGSPQELPLVGEVGLLVAGGRLPDRAATERAAQPGWDEAVAQVVADLAAFRQRYGAELAHFRPEIFQSTELAAWHAEAQRVGRRWFGKRKRWQAVADRLAPYRRGDVAVPGEQVEHVLGRLLAAHAEAEQVRERVRQLGGLRLPDDWSATADDAETALATARRATETSRALLARSPDIWGELTSGIDSAQAATLHEAATVWTRWWDALRAGDPQLELWITGSHWYDAWQRDGAVWREDLETGLLPLQRWGEVLRLTDVLAEAGLDRFRERLLRAEVAATVAEEVYQRGVARASLAERVESGDHRGPR